MKSGLWLYFIYLAVALTLSSGAVSAAEGDTMEVLSDYDFAVKTFGEKSEQARAARIGHNSDIITCGYGNCSTKTQKCIKCYHYQATRGYFVHKCIPINETAEKYNNLNPQNDEDIVRCEDAPLGGENSSHAQMLGVTQDTQECSVGSDGNKYCLYKKGSSVVFTYAGDSYEGCEVLPVKLYKQKECFFCPLFGVIYRAADEMASLAMDKLAAAFATLIALGLGIWIAFQTLTHVSSLTKQDAPKFLGNLLKQGFKFIIAFLLLQYQKEVYTWIVNPLLKSGLEFGQNLLSYKLSGIDEQNIATVGGNFYTQATYVSLHRFIAAIQNSIAFMQAIGTSLMCIGGNLMINISLNDWELGTGFQMMIQGLILAIFGFLLSLAFAFYLIDAVVQLGIVGALMPFMIACWPFKLTAQYTNKGFSMLLNSFFVFVFVGLVVSINLKLVDSALGSTQKTTTETAAQPQENQKPAKKTGEQNFGALMQIANAINEQRMETKDGKPGLRDLTDIGGVGFLILLFCCIFGFKFCGQSSALADKMAGGGMKAIAPSIATMGASATLSAAKKVSQPMREAVADKVTEVGGNALRKAGAFITGRGGRHGQKPAGGGGEDSGSEESGTPESTASKNAGAGAKANNNTRVLGQKGRTNQDGTPSKSGGPASGQGTKDNVRVLGQKSDGSAAEGKKQELTQAERRKRARENLENTRGEPRRGKGNRSSTGSHINNRKISWLRKLKKILLTDID